MSREDNIEIFEDTIKQCKNNDMLKKCIDNSLRTQSYIKSNDIIDISNILRNEKECEIIVSKKRTFEAAKQYKEKKICVLNFASSTSPGGGVTRGSTAQEECLCRCSTLYPMLNCKDSWNNFYKPHKDNYSNFATDDCIFTPNVVVFKTDTNNPTLLQKDDWYFVDVITCAAPNLKPIKNGKIKDKITEQQLFDIQYKRISKVMDVAIKNEDKILILGAFGCGVFMNSPYIVAMAMKKALEERKNYFEIIEFAIYCSQEENKNYETFNRILKRK